MLELIRIALTLFIITMLGNWLEPHVAAGHYWAPALVIVGALVLGYIVGTPDDRQEFRDAPRAIVVWFVYLPMRFVSRLRSYSRRA